MRKLGWILIGIIFITMFWTILALWNPAVGEGTRILFIDIIGANLVNAITGASNTIMTWGTTGFPQAMAVFFGIGVTWLIIGIGFSRLIWPHIPYIHKKAPITEVPLQSQLGTPELYTQKPQTVPVPVQEQKVEEKQ